MRAVKTRLVSCQGAGESLFPVLAALVVFEGGDGGLGQGDGALRGGGFGRGENDAAADEALQGLVDGEGGGFNRSSQHRLEILGVPTERSVPFGKYWRSRPLVFSLVARCHGLCGSAK